MSTLRKDGRLQSSVTITNPYTGVKEKKYVYGYSEEEIQAEKERLIREVDTLFLIDMSFKTWCEEFIRMKYEENLEYTTIENYEYNINKYILPQIPKNLTVSGVAIYHVKNILRNIKGQRTKQLVYTILNGIFNAAKREQLIEKNPCEYILKPKYNPNKAKIIVPNMYLTLMHTIQGTQLQYLYTFAWGTGMRRGEISALRWCDFDEVNGTITIEHAAKRTKKRGEYIGKPKSHTSERKLKLSPSTVRNLQLWKEVLKEILYEAKIAWDDKGYIFRSTKWPDKKLPIGTITNTFAKLRIKLGFPKGVRFHSFRPTNATILAEHNINPKKIQLWLGHFSAAFSLNQYVHATQTMQIGISDAIEAEEISYEQLFKQSTNIN